MKGWFTPGRLKKTVQMDCKKHLGLTWLKCFGSTDLSPSSCLFQSSILKCEQLFCWSTTGPCARLQCSNMRLFFKNNGPLKLHGIWLTHITDSRKPLDFIMVPNCGYILRVKSAETIFISIEDKWGLSVLENMCQMTSLCYNVYSFGLPKKGANFRII